MPKQFRKVPACEWWSRVSTNCGTISGRYWPVRDADTYEYTCKADEFLKQPTYPVQFTNKDGSRLVAWNNCEAKAITITEFSQNQDFVQELLRDWDDGTPVRSAQLLVQFCTSCERRVVIDGVHHIIHIAANRTLDADLYITELAGPEWPHDMPDMSVVCRCRRTVL